MIQKFYFWGYTKKNGKQGLKEITCTPTFIAALLTIGEMWNQSKWPSIDKWTNKMWYIYTAEYYSSLKRKEIQSQVTT